MIELSTNGLWINNGKTFISIEPVDDQGKEFCLLVMDMETGSKSTLMKREDLRGLSALSEHNYCKGERI